MTSKQPPGTPASASHPSGTAGGTAGGSAATATTTNPSDPAALLLNILRSVDREVRSTLELDENAKRVVERFRAIDLALRVRPVAVATASSVYAPSVSTTGAAASVARTNP